MGLLDKIRDRITGDEKPKRYEVIFTEDRLGLTLESDAKGEAVVTGVTGPAGKGHVRPGDKIEWVNETTTPFYPDVLKAIRVAGRPVVLGFVRPGAGGGEGQGSNGTAGAGQGPNPFQRAQEAVRLRMDDKKKLPQPAPMTDEAKTTRREATLKAAEARTKNWDKRLNKGRQASHAKTAIDGTVDNKFEDLNNPETRRLVELAKRQEARTAEGMGYNPYEARLMGNTAARAAISGGAAGGGGGESLSSSPPPPPPNGRVAAAANTRTGTGRVLATGEEAEEWFGEDEALAGVIGTDVEEALTVVLEQGRDSSLAAIQTMLKIMKNMAAKASEDKFKRVRLGNPLFNSKVGSVDGGIEVMTAAGFKLEIDGEEPVLQHGSCEPVPLRLRVAIRTLKRAEASLTGGDKANGSPV